MKYMGITTSVKKAISILQTARLGWFVVVKERYCCLSLLYDAHLIWGIYSFTKNG